MTRGVREAPPRAPAGWAVAPARGVAVRASRPVPRRQRHAIARSFSLASRRRRRRPSPPRMAPEGRDGVYYCSNWTTPGNCHDMSLLSGFICAHAVGAPYPFEGDVEAKKDFSRLRDLMGV